MRWPTPKALPSGLRRTVVRFAWLPVDCDNGETVWLEYYAVRQVSEWEPPGWDSNGRMVWADTLCLPIDFYKVLEEMEKQAVAA